MDNIAKAWRLDWRTAEGVSRSFRSRTFRSRAVLTAFVAAATARGAVLGDEYRITPLGADGRAAAPCDTDASAVAAWKADEPLPAKSIGAWAEARAKATTRRRVVAAVRGALALAWRERHLDREQASDLVRIVDMTFDGLGPAARRIPPD